MPEETIETSGRRSFLQATCAAGAIGIAGGVVRAERREPGSMGQTLLVGISNGPNVRRTAARVREVLPEESDVVRRNETMGYLAVWIGDERNDAPARPAKDRLRRIPGVKYVEENATYRPVGGSVRANDPLLDDQYAPQQVRAPEAWTTTTGSDDVTIAIVDVGVEYDHPDLADRFGEDPGKDFVDDDGDPRPDSRFFESHGTHVAGIAAGTIANGTGIAGMANARLLSCRVLDPRRSGATTADLVDGIQWATDRGADVVNLSLAGGSFSYTLKAAVSYALHNGALPVCAAGNGGVHGVSYPAAYDECLAVGAVDETENLTDFSQYGPELDVVAPGKSVLSCSTRKNGYEEKSGTSMAAPVVAGVAALGLSAHPQWSATKLRSKLKETAVDVGEDDDHQGAGRVDAANLVGSSEANTVPSAAFTIAPSSPSVDETVRFDASATTDSEGSITAYEWTFGDGATATGRASNHEFASPGTYAVTLTVADDAGGTDTVSKTVTVGAEISTAAPSASFTTTPSTAWVREGIAFDATGSTDPDGTIVTYEWDFGDGETATGRTMGHSFDSPGAYTVTLTVVDDAGESDTASKTVHVGRSSAGPAASFTATPSSPWVGEGIAFDARGSDVSNGTIVSYEWAFGDGTTATGTVTGHSFDASGTYTVTLTVADDAGRTDSVSEIVSVAGANAPPSASFTTRPSTASNGRTVSFDATGSTARDGSIERYEWTFGDGTTTTGKRVTHSYDASRDFTVSLTVTDDSGTTETVAKSIAVTPETDDQCASESKTKTTTIEGVSNGHWDSQQYSYRTRLSDTCQVTVILDGPDGSDFDLYVTTDGRTPSSHDFDRRSVGPNSQEAVVLEGVGSKRELGILVDPYAGSGRFSLSIEELGR